MTDWHHIRQLPSGAWQVRMRVEGRNISETFPADPENPDRPPAAAIRFRDTLDLEARLRRHGLPGMMRPRPYLAAIVKAYVDEQEERVLQGEISDRTNQGYWERTRGILKWIDAEHPGLRADELDDRLLSQYVTWRLANKLNTKATRKPSKVMVAKELKVLRRIYRLAGVERRWKTPKLPASHGGKRILEIDQLFAMLDAMDEGSLERAFCELGICTGLRPKNLRELTLDEIDWQERIIRTTAAKTGRPLVNPFDDHVERHLKAWLARRMPATHRLVFHLDGRPLTSSTLRRRLAAASKAAKIEPPVEYPGLLRNSFLAYLRDSGVSWDDLAQYVDHADVRTTQAYARKFLPMRALRRVARAAEELRSGESVGSDWHGEVEDG